MTTAPIRDRVQAFKTSSSFSGGDPFSFSISLDKDLKLPGRHDPVDYLKRLDADLKDKTVCVVCPGNGGLCVEALRAGAASVSAFELRSVYYKSLKAVSAFTKETLGREIDVLGALKPNYFDVVIWSEGVDDIRDPSLVIESAIKSIAPGGVLYLEVAHGTAGAVPERTNSWKPSKDGLLATLGAYPSLKVSSETDGRNQVRKIYTVKDIRLPVATIPAGVPAPTVEVLSAPPEFDTSDVEYFRTKLMAGIAKMREQEQPKADVEQPAPVAADPASELSEVFDREPEPEAGKPSTPKSRRRSGKESKS